MVRLMLEWYDWGPPDVGGSTAMALMCWKGGFEPPPDESVQGNGGLMRAAAHAIGSDTLTDAQRCAAEDTRLTHNSDLAAECSALIAGTAWALIQGADPDAAYKLALRSYDYGEAHPDRLSPYERPTHDMGGHCVHTLRLALWASLRADSYEAGIEAVIQTGGDTDTNACVAGALLGARFGKRGIPQRWVRGLHPDNKKRLDREFVRLLPLDGEPHSLAEHATLEILALELASRTPFRTSNSKEEER